MNVFPRCIVSILPHDLQNASLRPYPSLSGTVRTREGAQRNRAASVPGDAADHDGEGTPRRALLLARAAQCRALAAAEWSALPILGRLAGHSR